MSNDRLRTALKRAGLSTEAVARQAEVDPKTVQKWLTGRVPHPRHRWSVSRLVDEEEDFLWPDARRDQPGGLDSAAEIVSAFPHRANVDSTRWRSLLDQAGRQIDILGYTIYFLPQQIPELVDVLFTKCVAGCRVRVIIADPNCDQVSARDLEEQEPITIVARIQTSLRAFAPLLDCENAELRFQTAPLYNSVYRFDDEMFVTPHLYATPGHSAPLLHLRRLGSNGIFSRFEAHYEGLWSDCEPIGQDRWTEYARAGS